jgi:hypothetical protein
MHTSDVYSSGTVLSCDTMELSHNIMELSHNSMELSHDTMELSHNTMELSHNSMELSHNTMELSHNTMELSHNSMELSHNSMELSHNSMELSHNTMELSHNHSCHGNATMSLMCSVQPHINNIHSKNVTTCNNMFSLSCCCGMKYLPSSHHHSYCNSPKTFGLERWLDRCR